MFTVTMKNEFLLFARLLGVLLSLAQAACSIAFSNTDLCKLRCIANCMSRNAYYTARYCLDDICDYDDDMCDQYDTKCWQTCSYRLPMEKFVTSPYGFTYKYVTPYNVFVSWSGSGTVYLITYAYIQNNSWIKFKISKVASFSVNKSRNQLCDKVNMTVLAVTAEGVSPIASITVPPPIPTVSNYSISTIEYVDARFKGKKMLDSLDKRLQASQEEPIVQITVNYDLNAWPPGSSDVHVRITFYRRICQTPSTGQTPASFSNSSNTGTVTIRLPAIYMYHICEFHYYVSYVNSVACNTNGSISKAVSFKNVTVACSTVANSRCIDASTCGSTSNFIYRILSDGPSSNNVKPVYMKLLFDYRDMGNTSAMCYYAFYGFATVIPNGTVLNGVGNVQLANILGNATNCHKTNPDHSENLLEAHFMLAANQLYGVVICAVYRIDDLSFPIFADPKTWKAYQIQLNTSTAVTSSSISQNLVLPLLFGIAVASCLFGFCGYCIFRRVLFKKRVRNFENSLVNNLRQIRNHYMYRHERGDPWEIDRKDLTIYTNRLLGTGAFGSVYLGCLSKSVTGALAQFNAALRNPDAKVAVKMLPDIADIISKSDFLKEISLMKTLGYDERLVNMLACITRTEPLCLVVEYCSDGDLLHFLRQKRNFLFKLAETKLCVGSSGKAQDDNCDMNMPITYEQLLKFAVQISGGMEYLSQKGFVHRDLAARNIMVHNKTAAKIGDFGLCRYVYASTNNYIGRGGRLPVKWMSPEAIRNYEFTTQSDMWSFGVLLFEIITLGGTPYPGIQPEDMLKYLDEGGRMQKPDNCPDCYYEVMESCWQDDPGARPDFTKLRHDLSVQLEKLTDDNTYLTLDAQRNYYTCANDN